MKLLAISLVSVLALGSACPIPNTQPPAPTPSVSPVATPTPDPIIPVDPDINPTPTPEPTLMPTPEPVIVCNARPNRPRACAFDPHSGSEPFRADLQRAMDAAESAGLSIDGQIGNDKLYVDFIAKTLTGYGLCAINGSAAGHTEEDEIWIRIDDQLSDHYDIVAGPVGGKYRWIKRAATCNPAMF